MDPDHGRQRWQRRYDAARLRDADFSTLSGLDVDPVYGPPDGAVVPGFERIGWPAGSAGWWTTMTPRTRSPRRPSPACWPGGPVSTTRRATCT